MAKPSYIELVGYLDTVQEELQAVLDYANALKKQTHKLKQQVYWMRRRIKEGDQEIEKKNTANARKRMQYREEKEEAIARVCAHPDVIAPPKKNGAVANGERIIKRYLQTNRQHARKPHDKFPKEMARIADLMYTELEREDGSLPPSMIQERLSKQGLLFNVEIIKMIAASHEWFTTIRDGLSAEADVAIARCGGDVEPD